MWRSSRFYSWFIIVCNVNDLANALRLIDTTMFPHDTYIFNFATLNDELQKMAFGLIPTNSL